MMKKRIVMLFLAIFLVGCTPKPQDEPVVVKEPEVKEEVEKEKVEVETVEDPKVEEPEDSTPDPEPEPEPEVEHVPDTSMSAEEFAIATFAEYGKTVDASMWSFQEQGPNKIAVVIKEHPGRGRPNISKLIFLWYGDADSAEILHIMVDNHNYYGNE